MRKIKLVADVYKNLDLYDLHAIDTDTNEKIYSLLDYDMGMVIDEVLKLESNGCLSQIVYVYHDNQGLAYNKKEQYFN